MRSVAPERYVRRMLAVVLLALFLAGLLNTLVNPLRVTPAPWSLDLFNSYRVVERYERTAKAGYVRSGDWDAAIFGSSRMDSAINPAAPAFAGHRAVNLSLSAGKLTENVAMLRYALEHEKLGLVLFGVDLMDLCSPPRELKGDYYASPLAPAGLPLDRELQYIFGVNRLNNSFTVIRRAIRGKPSEHTEQGHWHRARPTGDQSRQIERNALAQAFGLYRARLSGARINPEKAHLVSEMIALCRQSGVQLKIVLPPNHAAFNACLYLLGDADPTFSAERGFLVRLVAEDNARHSGADSISIWDFDDFHPFNCEPISAGRGNPMVEWIDIKHCDEGLGAIMSAAVLDRSAPSQSAAGYGYKLTSENLSDRAAQLREGYDRYVREHAGDVVWIQVVLDQLKSQASALIPSAD